MSLTCRSGHSFDEASIPLPTTTPHDGLTVDIKLNRRTLDDTETTSNITVRVDEAQNGTSSSTVGDPTSPELSTTNVARKRSRASSEDVGDLSVPVSNAKQGARQRDGAVASPANIATSEADEHATLDDATQDLLDLDTPERPTKVVRLTTEDEQRVTEQENGRRRSDGSSPTKTSRNHLAAQGEAASSPSSTVGAYSAATPMPPQDSPDTSPDSETGEQIEVLPPKELRPSLEEQRQKGGARSLAGGSERDCETTGVGRCVVDT